MVNDLGGQTLGSGRTVTQTKAFQLPSPRFYPSATFSQRVTRLSQCHPEK